MGAPPVGAGLGAGILAGATVASPIAGAIIQNIGSARQAKRAMEFSERMRNTQHQAEVKDLLAAGLNPILSAGGSGASSPEGVFYQPENIFNGVPEAIRSAANTLPERGKKIAEMQLTTALGKKADVEVQNAIKSGDLITAQKERELSSARVNNATARSIDAQIPEKRARGNIGGLVSSGLDAVKNGIGKAAEKIAEIHVKTQRDDASYQKKIDDMEKQGYHWNVWRQRWEK